MPRGVDLNYDILLEVMRKCPSRDDCLSLMYTSRFLYEHGFAVLLSSHGLPTFHTEEKLLQCISSLRSLGTKTFALVHTLHLTFFELSEEGSIALMDALPLMSNLKELLICYSEDVLLSHPRLTDVFASLTSMKNLTMTYLGKEVVRMLQSLRSELVIVRIDFLSMHGRDSLFDITDRSEWRLYHPTILLSHSKDTLEEITSYQWYMNQTTAPQEVIVYPRMCRLYLEEALLPLTLSLIRSYPNLVHLSFNMDHREYNWFHQHELDLFNTRHNVNVRDQLTSGVTWPELAQLKGSLSNAYTLGLTCPVGCMRLCYIYGHMCYMLHALLTRCRPRHLALEVWRGIPRSSEEHKINSIFRGVGVSRLETLHIDMGLGNGDRNVDVAAMLESLLSALAESAPLQELNIVVQVPEPDSHPTRSSEYAVIIQSHLSHLSTPALSGPEEYLMCPAERSANDLDLSKYARTLIQRISTLQHAKIVVSGPRRLWRKVTVVNGRVVGEERLDDAHGSME
ncbi:hypothetical protein C8Q77DRAFT_1137170 [Trametes polyzona]|nr:hypothetical protein C8Q77DRAFT_1137170 [Trametes polyzona]